MTETNDETTEAPRHHQACQDKDGHPAGLTPCPLKRAGVLAVQLEQIEESRDTWEGKARRLRREVDELSRQLRAEPDDRRAHLAELLTRTVAERDKAQHQLDDVKQQLARQVEAELLAPLRKAFPDSFVPVETETEDEYEAWDEDDDDYYVEPVDRVTVWALAPGVTVKGLVEQLAEKLKLAEDANKATKSEMARLLGQYNRSVEERARLNATVKGIEAAHVAPGSKLLVVGVPSLKVPAVLQVPGSDA